MSNKAKDLDEALSYIRDHSGAIPYSRLYSLSDLMGEQRSAFLDTWQTLSAEQRRNVLRALVELTEASFEVNFDAIFRYCLDDPDEQARTAAIDGLWESEDTDLIGPFLTMLTSDPSGYVRAAAASGLGRYVLAGQLEKLEAPVQARIMADLLTTIHAPNESIEVRRRALESVSYGSTPEITDALEMAYLEEDEHMRISAVMGMGRSCDTRWKSIVLQELDSESTAMRYEAAWACGELMLRSAVPFLAQLVQDPDRQVGNAAIWALGQIGGPQAKQVLAAAYDDADADTVAALDEAIAEAELSDGNLDFLLYEFDHDLEDELLDDALLTLWNADDDAEDW